MIDSDCFSDIMMRLALGDPEFVELMFARARRMQWGMLDGDLEALEDWAR